MIRSEFGISFYINSFSKFSNISLFSYYTFDVKGFFIKVYDFNLYSSFLFMFDNFKRLSNLIIFRTKSRYSCSSGSFCMINFKNYNYTIAKVSLPSKEIKYFHFLDVFSNGQSSLEDKKKLIFSKAGFKSKMRNKVKVRGVAKNPVDHPHGGNTKSIKFPRTPWGLATKLK